MTYIEYKNVFPEYEENLHNAKLLIKKAAVELVLNRYFIVRDFSFAEHAVIFFLEITI